MAIKSITEQHPQVYTDLNALNKIKREAKTDSPEALKQVAQQFEQMFMDMLMKSMREANATFIDEDSPFNSSEVSFYQNMLDSQMTTNLAQGQGIGLADLLVKQLGKQFDIRVESDAKPSESLSEAEALLNRAFNKGSSAAVNNVFEQLKAHQVIANAAQAPTDGETLEQTMARLKDSFVDAPQPTRFDSPQAFVDALLPIAEKVAGELGVDPKVLVAQAALETGWGKHIIQEGEQSSFNLFNIKADSRWGGENMRKLTLEYRDGVAQKEQAFFRSYASYEASFRDYVDFLQSNPRYQQALEVVADPKAYLQQLQAAGYATDPAYAEKITSIYEGRLQALADNDAKEG
ncbi:flagellar assembly peptidoglycan hydrolase FlgJ [Neptunomonas sp. XY-337]|uniref:flagellar assembly peptidoglycan hydrolase FlgJ n=1 Tax=Neptunomonas sp. XY-337 TaxID=2561897 RepID=UPI0010AA7AAD|nr:flagellar assembly peptidoglycan hydrolase FlgJ [Neptunomonas sp. XY-337]